MALQDLRHAMCFWKYVSTYQVVKVLPERQEHQCPSVHTHKVVLQTSVTGDQKEHLCTCKRHRQTDRFGQMNRQAGRLADR